MSTFLETIRLSTLQSVKQRKKRNSFLNSLREASGPVVIAEVKKQSPSLGELNLTVDPANLALSYMNSGATAVSILTESRYFKGSLEDLLRVRALNAEIPLLQKDFIIDEYQILEAKFLGADCILLIVALLGIEETKRLYDIAVGLELSVLVEVHTEEELHQALSIKTKLIGINNRDLHTLKISLDVSRQLIQHIPRDVFVISESGITSSDEVRELSSLGFHGFLIGSSLMQSESPGSKLSQIIEEARS